MRRVIAFDDTSEHESSSNEISEQDVSDLLVGDFAFKEKDEASFPQSEATSTSKGWRNCKEGATVHIPLQP